MVLREESGNLMSVAIEESLKLVCKLFLKVTASRYLINLFYGNCSEVPEKAMAPHSSAHAWKIPWTKEPGRLQSMGSLRVRHD